MPKSFLFILIAILFGNTLIWYDFMVYGFEATAIANHFFPSLDPSISLIFAYASFAFSFFLRPLGALIFGYIADKNGRKSSFLITIILITFSTMGVGLLPDYSQIGIWAPILLLGLRFIQGLAIGGEYMSALVYLVESGSIKRRGFFANLPPISVSFGILLASGIITLMLALISESEFQRWGWRVPFLLSLPTGLIAVLLRMKCEESPIYRELKEAALLSKNPILESTKTAKGQIVTLMGLTVAATVSAYLMGVFLPGFLTQAGGMTLKDSFYIVMMINTVRIVSSLFWGWLSDYLNRKRLMMAALTSLIFIGPLTFYIIMGGNFWMTILICVISIFLLSIYASAYFAFIVDMFPAQIRVTALSFGYNFIVAILGGSTPLIVTLFIKATGSQLAPGYYLSISVIISLITLLLYKK